MGSAEERQPRALTHRQLEVMKLIAEGQRTCERAAAGSTGSGKFVVGRENEVQ